MARTTSAAVIALLGLEYDADGAPSLDVHIDSASVLVDQVVTCAAAKSVTISGGTAELIERWLACHFYQGADPGYSSRSTAGKSGSFLDGSAGEGLRTTRYGKRAILLDYSGCLNNLDKRNYASAVWLGKTDGEKLTYDERMS